MDHQTSENHSENFSRTCTPAKVHVPVPSRRRYQHVVQSSRTSRSYPGWATGNEHLPKHEEWRPTSPVSLTAREAERQPVPVALAGYDAEAIRQRAHDSYAYDWAGRR